MLYIKIIIIIIIVIVIVIVIIDYYYYYYFTSSFVASFIECLLCQFSLICFMPFLVY